MKMKVALFEKNFNQLKSRSKANLKGIEAIQQWLLNCHEVERIRINPYDIVHQTALDLAIIIPEMLHGVAIGLFDLYWDIRCPHCNMVTND
jgi:hypothetical protein